MLSRRIFRPRKRFPGADTFEHDLENVCSLRRGAILSSASPEAIAEVLFSSWGGLRRGESRSTLIDPGFRSQVTFFAVQQSVLQYLSLNALFLEYDGLAYLYMPHDSSENLSSVKATPWPNAEVVGEAAFSGWLSNLIQGTNWKGVHKKENPIERTRIAVKPLDFAPIIGLGLASLIPFGQDFPGPGVLKALEFLDLLQRFRGDGSDEFKPASVSLERATLLNALDKKVYLDPDERSVLETIEAYDNSLLGITYRGDMTRVTALAFKHHKLDGTTGRESTLVELKLRIEPPCVWQFDRRMLWKDRQEGMELS